MTPEPKTLFHRPHRALTGFLVIAVISSGALVPTALAHADDAVPAASPATLPKLKSSYLSYLDPANPGKNAYKLDEELRSIPELKRSFGNGIDTSKVKLLNRFASSEVNSDAPFEENDVSSAALLGSTGFDFENPSLPGRDQTPLMPSLNFTDTTTVTNMVTKGFKLGVEFSAEQEAGVIFAKAKTTEKVSTGYEMSWADSTAYAKSVSYVLPPEPITVPAGWRVHATAVMRRAKGSGKLALTGDLVGDVVLHKPCGGDVTVPVGKLLSMTRQDGSRVAPSHITPQGDSARFVGESQFDGVWGLNLALKYEFTSLSNPNDHKVDTKPVPPSTPVPTASQAPPAPVSQATTGGPLTDLTDNVCPGSGDDRTIENLQISSADLTNYLDYTASAPGGAVVKDWDRNRTQTHGTWTIAPLGNGDGRFRLLAGHKTGLCLAMTGGDLGQNPVFQVVVQKCEDSAGFLNEGQLWSLVRESTAAGEKEQKRVIRAQLQAVAESGGSEEVEAAQQALRAAQQARGQAAQISAASMIDNQPDVPEKEEALLKAWEVEKEAATRVKEVQASAAEEAAKKVLGEERAKAAESGVLNQVYQIKNELKRSGYREWPAWEPVSWISMRPVHDNPVLSRPYPGSSVPFITNGNPHFSASWAPKHRGGPDDDKWQFVATNGKDDEIQEKLRTLSWPR